jgi:hypothetical protein
VSCSRSALASAVDESFASHFHPARRTFDILIDQVVKRATDHPLVWNFGSMVIAAVGVICSPRMLHALEEDVD